MVDALVEKIVSANTRDELVTVTRALDRQLQWGYYMVPNWYLSAWRIAYWDKFEKPDIAPTYGLGITDTWWAKE